VRLRQRADPVPVSGAWDRFRDPKEFAMCGCGTHHPIRGRYILPRWQGQARAARLTSYRFCERASRGRRTHTVSHVWGRGRLWPVRYTRLRCIALKGTELP
jgi:hypothetical protein